MNLTATVNQLVNSTSHYANTASQALYNNSQALFNNLPEFAKSAATPTNAALAGVGLVSAGLVAKGISSYLGGSKAQMSAPSSENRLSQSAPQAQARSIELPAEASAETPVETPAEEAAAPARPQGGNSLVGQSHLGNFYQNEIAGLKATGHKLW